MSTKRSQEGGGTTFSCHCPGDFWFSRLRVQPSWFYGLAWEEVTPTASTSHRSQNIFLFLFPLKNGFPLLKVQEDFLHRKCLDNNVERI